jgi:hypothetical protein
MDTETAAVAAQVAGDNKKPLTEGWDPLFPSLLILFNGREQLACASISYKRVFGTFKISSRFIVKVEK